MIRTCFLLTLLGGLGLGARAQTGAVGIGTAAPHASAALEVSSPAGNQGFLPPRLTYSQRTGISNAAAGLLVYQTDASPGPPAAPAGYYYHTGTQWLPLGQGDNLGSHAATQDVDLQAYALRMGNTPGGNLVIGANAGTSFTFTGAAQLNLLLGAYSGQNTTTGHRNAFVGYAAGGENTTGTRNCFVGNWSGLSNTSGNENSFHGIYSGYSNTSGSGNYFGGYESGYSNTTAGGNHFVGYQSGRANTSGSQNQFEGYQAGYANTIGIRNHFSGYQAGFANVGGNYNYFSGYHAGLQNSGGSDNTFVGAEAGQANTTGAGNVFVGSLAGANTAGGSLNTALGTDAGPITAALSNTTALGYRARARQSNTLILGGTDAYAVQVGINTDAPQARLDVVGFLRVSGATNTPSTGTVPELAFRELTATLPATAGQQVLVSHGLTDSKILGLQVLVDCASGNTAPPGLTDNPGELFFAYLNAGRVVLRTGQGSSSSQVLGRSARILITYKE